MRNDPRRWAAAGLAVLIGLAAARCETADDLIPNTGGVFAVLRDGSLGFQFAPESTRQFTLWRVEALTLSIAELPEYSFLPSGTCTLVASPVAEGSPSTSCRGSALTVRAADAPLAAIVRLDIFGMETVSARRPSLPSNQDYDGDGVVNSLDNCKIVFNPDQEVFGPNNSDCKGGGIPHSCCTGSGTGTCGANLPGIACAADDGAGDPTLPDQDNDDVRDSLDNCLWYPNPLLPGDLTQTDANRNGIGDLCEVSAPITFPGTGRLSFACPGALTSNSGTRFTFAIDFTDALDCDPNFGVCSLDPARVTMGRLTELRTVVDTHACVVSGSP